MKTLKSISKFLCRSVLLPACLVSLVCFAQTKEIDSTLNFIKQHNRQDTTTVNALLYVSSIYQALNLDKAIEYASQAKSIAEKYGNKYTVALCISRLASIDSWRNKTTEALSGYLKEIDIGNSIKEPALLQDAYDGIAYVYEMEEDWDKSMQYAFKSLGLAQKTALLSDDAYPYHQLGSAYRGKGEYIKAEQYVKKAKALFALDGDTDRIATCHVDLAKIYMQLKYFNLARPHLDSAINLFLAWDEQYQLAETYHTYGLLSLQQGLFDDGEIYFTKELDIYNKYRGDIIDHAHATIGLGQVAIARKDYKQAISILKAEISSLQAVGDKERQLDCLEYLATADSSMKNYIDAFYSMQRYKDLKDSVYNEKKSKATERTLIELGVERQDNESKILQTKYDEQQNRLIIILVAVVLLLVGIVMLILLYRQKSEAFKAIEKLQEETAYKNKEMASANNVKDKLISMIAHDVRSPLASVQNTLTLTREGILNTEEFKMLSQMLEMDIQHLMGMLDNTLLWAREQMIDISVKKIHFNLYKVISGVIELYNQTMISKNVTIYNNISKDAEVYSDIDIVSTVLRNILSNAVKFTPQGKNIYLQQTNTKNKLLISVKDEGVGITDDVLKKINNKEFISTRGTDNEKGTGLGLLFSRDLLLKLDEDFQISSVPGKGTAITISLSTHE